MLGALFGFSGRLSRPGFWEVLLSVVLIDTALVIGRMYVADSGLPGGLGPGHPMSQAVMNATPWVLVIFTLWSGLAAMVKRFHDRGRTGFLVLVGLIPVLGWLWLLVDLFFLEGTEGRNAYGKAPHSSSEAPERGRFDWSAEAPAAGEAQALADPHHRMPDPEPVFDHHPPHDDAHDHDTHGHDAHAHDAHADAHGHAAHDHGHGEPAHHDDPHAHDHGHEPAHHDASPIPEPTGDHGHGDHHHAAAHDDHHPAVHDDGHRAVAEPEPYDPLNAPLVLHIR